MMALRIENGVCSSSDSGGSGFADDSDGGDDGGCDSNGDGGAAHGGGGGGGGGSDNGSHGYVSLPFQDSSYNHDFARSGLIHFPVMRINMAL